MVMLSDRRIEILPRLFLCTQRLRSLHLVLLLSVVLAAGCEAKKTSTPTLSSTKVVVAQVEEQDIPIIMEFPGTLQAFRQIAIVPRVSGFIFERDFVEGAFVGPFGDKGLQKISVPRAAVASAEILCEILADLCGDPGGPLRRSCVRSTVLRAPA